MKRVISFSVLGLAAAGLGAALLTVGIEPGLAAKFALPNNFPLPNPSGFSSTISDQGEIDLSNPFFQNLGTNGRACVSCHEPDQGWAISAAAVKARFELTGGTHAIFRTNDGSTCDHDIDVSTVAGRRNAYALLLDRGLIRVGVAPKAGADFTVDKVENQYHCNETSTLSMYRRPLPATNLRFIASVMWDGRESTPASTEAITAVTYPNALQFDLMDQAMGATKGHAQGIDLSPENQQKIVEFERSLHTAQIFDNEAGPLFANGAQGGPGPLATQSFAIGVNDKSVNPTTTTEEVFTLFTSWADSKGNGRLPAARASIARGEALFNTKHFTVTGVRGLNDLPNIGGAPVSDTCSGCHNTPNVGNRPVDKMMDIGVADPVLNKLGLSYLPTITVRKGTETIVTTDPGRALITGKWADMNKQKTPVLRGLASRAPYFHNGSARTLADAVEFYNQRFNIGLTAQEKADLAAFLGSL